MKISQYFAKINLKNIYFQIVRKFAIYNSNSNLILS